MIDGHGDDGYKYARIRANFSSNVYGGMDHTAFYAWLGRRMGCVRSYPEPEPYSLERELAARYDVDPACVCVTNGATEGIYLVAQAFRESGSAILIPTFSEYADACRMHAHRVHYLFSLDYLPSESRLVWLCNPNNPTGEVRDLQRLRELVGRHPERLFVIDQSYEAFTDKELFEVKEAAAYPNVLLLHSLTKRFAIPGLRLGFVTGNGPLIDQLRACRMPWSVNALAIEAGRYLLRHAHYYPLCLADLLEERARVSASLERIGGVEVWPSDTHFLLARLRTGKAAALKEFLADEKGLLIRDASNMEGLDDAFFRLAVQQPEEDDDLISSIKEWIYMV